MNDAVQNLRVRTSIDGVDKANAQLTGMGANIKKLAVGLLPVVTATTLMIKAFGLLKQSIVLAEEQIAVERKLASQVRATGQAAGFTAGQLEKMSTELQKISNFGDEEILRDLTIPLLTFKAVSGDVFVRAQEAATKMATSLGMGLSGAAVMIGKALQDPIKGINAMARAGVSFTAAEKEMIRTLTESGRLVEAQTTILDALEGQFVESALAGVKASKQLKNAWNDYLEYKGKAIMPVFNAIVMTQAQMLMVMNDNLVKSGNKEADMQKARFNMWAEANTGIMLTFNGLADTIINTLDIVFRFIDLGVKSSTKSMGYFTDDLMYYFKNISNYAIGVFDIIGGIGSEVYKELEENKPSRNFTQDVATDAEKSLSAIGKTAKDIGRTWAGFEKDFSTIMWESTKLLNKQLELQYGIVKANADLIKDEAEDMIGSINADAISAFLAEIAALNDSEAAATKRKYDSMRKEALSYWADTSETYKLALAAINMAESKAASDSISAIINQKKTELEVIESAYSKQLKEIREYQSAGLLSAESYSKALTQIEQQRYDAISALQATQAAESLKFWQDEAAKRKEIVATQYELELSFTKDRERWLDIRSAQIQAEYDQHVKNGVNIVIAERWKTNEIQKLYTELVESMQTMAERSYNIMANAQMQFIQSVEHAVGGAINDMIMGTETLQSSMTKLWANIRASVIREISAMIAKMLVMLAVQKLLGGVTGNAGWLANLFGLAVPGTQPAAAPVSMPEATTRNLATGAGAIGSALPDTGNRQLTDAINQLRRDMQADRETNLNLYIDGQQLRHSLKKAEIRLNSMSS